MKIILPASTIWSKNTSKEIIPSTLRLSSFSYTSSKSIRRLKSSRFNLKTTQHIYSPCCYRSLPFINMFEVLDCASCLNCHICSPQGESCWIQGEYPEAYSLDLSALFFPSIISIFPTGFFVIRQGFNEASSLDDHTRRFVIILHLEYAKYVFIHPFSFDLSFCPIGFFQVRFWCSILLINYPQRHSFCSWTKRSDFIDNIYIFEILIWILLVLHTQGECCICYLIMGLC